jgi:hypothetical protein
VLETALARKFRTQRKQVTVGNKQAAGAGVAIILLAYLAHNRRGTGKGRKTVETGDAGC